MTQPDNFGFGEEAALLKDSARRLLAERLPTDALHRLVAGNPEPERIGDCSWSRELWQQLVELGWNALAVPEAQGGVGMPLVAVAGLVEELGRAALPGPLPVTLYASYVLAACAGAMPGNSGTGGGTETNSLAASALAEIAEGATATLAVTNRAGDWCNTATDVTFRDGMLNGTACYVQDARKVDRLLVSARHGDRVLLCWVPVDAPGVQLLPDAILDLTRDQAHVQFTQVAADILCADGAAALEAAMPAIWTLLAADMVGAAEWELQATVEYVGTRRQFDRPLGFFQAVKHPLVDVMIDIDQARSLVYNAACAFDTEPARARAYAHMAKAAASDLAAFAAGRSVQYHGGIGFTWECFVQLYFKRQQHSRRLWGDAAWHRARLAELWLGAA